MIILTHDRRKIIQTAVSEHPTAAWLSRQVTEAFPWDTAPRYLLRDRDASYDQHFRKRVAAMGLTEVITGPRSPWQNACVERVIGSIRRECLDHRDLQRAPSAPRPLVIRGLLPADSHPSLARQGLPRVTPGYATQGRKCRRPPESRWSAPPLRTARCLTRTTPRQSSAPAAHTPSFEGLGIKGVRSRTQVELRFGAQSVSLLLFDSMAILTDRPIYGSEPMFQ